MTASGATERLVSFVHDYRLDPGDQPLIEAAQALLRDYVGVAVAGLSGPVARAARLMEPGRSGPSTAYGTGIRASAHDAAMFNGMLAHSLEFDDSTLRPIGHPSCTILPTILALAEREGSTGRELIEAYVVGLEVHSRLGQAQSGNWESEGTWLPIGSIGQVGAAAAAARLLDLREDEIENCLGLAGHLAGQLSISIGTAAKAVGAGIAASIAVQAVDLARLGVQGPRRVIERARGMADTFFGQGGHRLDEALVDLGRPHHLLQHGIAIKKYPAVFACQWPNDALRGLLRKHLLSGDDILRIELLRPVAGAFCDCPKPASIEEARSSFEYNLAVIALTGNAGLDGFTEERLRDPVQVAMQQRITVTDHPPGTELRHTWRYLVRVHTRAGDSVENWVKYPTGHPKLPLNAEEVREKLVACAKDHLEPDVVSELSHLILDFAGQPTVRELAELLQSAR
jgi:2-methylcitrate dehydratase PrpD